MSRWNKNNSIAEWSGSTAVVPIAPFDLWQDAHSELLQYSQWTRLPFFCVDAETGIVISRSNDEVIPVLPEVIHARLTDIRKLEVVELNSEIVLSLFPMTPIDERPVVGVAYARTACESCPAALSLAAAEYDLSIDEMNCWWRQVPVIDCDLMFDLMQNIVHRMDLLRRTFHSENEASRATQQLERLHDEMDIMHSLTLNLQMSHSPAEMARLCLLKMNGVIRSECTAIWLADHHDEAVFYCDGEPLLSEIDLARLISYFDTHDWNRPVIQNHQKETWIEEQFPQLQNFIIVPVSERNHRFGWIISCNVQEATGFGPVESNLLKSIAIILGTQVRNIALYAKHDELLVSFVTSLVSTLDAKDPYTRGHSERVALVARCLADELGLPNSERDDIYLAGMLHDIGKIGVDDRVLRKDDALTPEEFEHIQQHPIIGYNILAGLKNLHRILPGVRNHHENFNGQGYPDKLKGTEISLMARILAVADSFDAMGSDRPYRKGMPLEKVEAIFRQGAGEQWDATVIDAYFRARDDVIAVCEQYNLDEQNRMKRVGRTRLHAWMPTTPHEPSIKSCIDAC
ncbi:MAG: HD-GYP domain-containing protein [Planctomycetota bacterium]|nr:HD-GYP domain-containing protein [Planctomycetota bacterium]MDA1211840.1 HD-GYP domain-containing protein [Planctomycetota bacterium]